MAAYTIRAQLIKPDETADVKKAIELLQSRIGVELSPHFTVYFSGILLEKGPFEEVDLLKVDVPSDATAETNWQVTRLARQRYYDPVKPERTVWDVPATVGYREAANLTDGATDTDVYVMRRERRVSVTPLSLDMTARVDLGKLEGNLR